MEALYFVLCFYFYCCFYFFFFFFQAEDGIRDRNVTGVQTCALPICRRAGLDCQLGAARVVEYAVRALRVPETLDELRCPLRVVGVPHDGALDRRDRKSVV